MRAWRGGALAALTVLHQACSGMPSLGLLGENFPPHDIRFQSYTAPEFPFRLRATAIGSGYAVIVMTVDGDGFVEDAVAVEASHPAFVEAVLEASADWQFAPDEGASLPRRELLHFEFRRSGVATSVSHREAARAPFDEIEAGQPAIRMVAAEDLMPARRDLDAGDGPVTAPVGLSGSADVSFVIDRLGYVRVPVVAADTDPEIAAAALAIVARWRYEPPVVDGDPVLVEVARTLRFGSGAQ